MSEALTGLDQDQAKYSSTNPVVRALIERWLATLDAEVDRCVGHDEAFVDVGAGAGWSLARFCGGRPVAAVELLWNKAEQLPGRAPGCLPVLGDATRLPLPDSAVGWASAIEVLEHLDGDGPDRVLDELARVVRHGAIVSVPWEPWFRLGNLGRGKNLARWGNDSEHVQAFGPRRLGALLARHFEQVDVQRRFPWLVAVARGPRSAPRSLLVSGVGQPGPSGTRA